MLIENLNGDALCNHFLLLLDEDVCQEVVALVPTENEKEEGEEGVHLCYGLLPLRVEDLLAKHLLFESKT